MATDDAANEWSVPCCISGCNATVTHDTRCTEHGGHPPLEWTETEWGEVTYHIQATQGKGLSRETTTD